MSSSCSARSALAIASLSLSVACDRPPESTAGWAEKTAAADDAVNTSPACGKPSATKPGAHALHVQIAGKTRNYTLVVPDAYDPARSFPLVYVLHGDGGSGRRVRAAFDLEREAAGKAFFLYPDADGAHWDLDAPAAKNADVALFDATLALTQSSYCIDLHRVYVAGFSAGAYMANQLACRRGDRIRAVATHSGGGPYEVTDGTYDEHGDLVCHGKPVGALVMNGLADGVVAPSEGQKSIEHWTQANHCGAPQRAGACATYASCTNPVVACQIPGLGHAIWPEAPKRAWAFFDSQN